MTKLEELRAAVNYLWRLHKYAESNYLASKVVYEAELNKQKDNSNDN